MCRSELGLFLDKKKVTYKKFYKCQQETFTRTQSSLQDATCDRHSGGYAKTEIYMWLFNSLVALTLWTKTREPSLHSTHNWTYLERPLVSMIAHMIRSKPSVSHHHPNEHGHNSFYRT